MTTTRTLRKITPYAITLGALLGALAGVQHLSTPPMINITPGASYASQHDARVPWGFVETNECVEEDGSGPADVPACRWDADTAGLANGGDSFIAYAIPNGTRYVYANGTVEEG